MFEAAELSHDVSKAAYRRQEPRLREALLNAQYDLNQNGRFPVLILIAGVEGAGKGETVNLLNLLSRHPRSRDLAVVAVFEGNDAAGKGGAIRRVTRASRC